MGNGDDSSFGRVIHDSAQENSSGTQEMVAKNSYVIFNDKNHRRFSFRVKCSGSQF